MVRIGARIDNAYMFFNHEIIPPQWTHNHAIPNQNKFFLAT